LQQSGKIPAQGTLRGRRPVVVLLLMKGDWKDGIEKYRHQVATVIRIE